MRNEFMDAMDRLNQEELEQLAKQQVRPDKGKMLYHNYAPPTFVDSVDT